MFCWCWCCIKCGEAFQTENHLKFMQYISITFKLYDSCRFKSCKSYHYDDISSCLIANMIIIMTHLFLMIVRLLLLILLKVRVNLILKFTWKFMQYAITYCSTFSYKLHSSSYDFDQFESLLQNSWFLAIFYQARLKLL